jgi:flagellar assembly protein FliH
MGKIIDSHSISGHNIQKFQFESVASSSLVETRDLVSLFSSAKSEEDVVVKNETDIDEKSSCSDDLLLKVDELSGEVISLQMQLENQQKEYESQLIEQKEIAYKKGVKESTDSAIEELEDIKMQYVASITKLEEITFKIESSLDGIEQELVDTSILIAKKVILKELESSSFLVSKAISSYLIGELKDISKVKLVVNPVDYNELSDVFSSKGIKVDKDSSVTRGGVMIYSGDKNIDATIESRLEQALQLIKES